MLIDEYFEYQLNFEKKYGTETLVLMQVGSFFEFYGVDNNEEKIGNLQFITELLNIQLTRRNKAILENSRSNCLMGGFPTHALKRFLQEGGWCECSNWFNQRNPVTDDTGAEITQSSLELIQEDPASRRL